MGGFDFFENIAIVLGGVGILIVAGIALSVFYYRCIKPRCCPSRPLPGNPPSTSRLPLQTIFQHVPPPLEANCTYQPVPQFNAQQQNMNPYYPQMPAQPPPSYYPPPPQFTVQA